MKSRTSSSSIQAQLHPAYTAFNPVSLHDVTQGQIPGLPVLLQVTVPENKTTSKSRSQRRIPVNLALCLDHSGSMAGDPWNHMKEGVRQILHKANLGDRIAIVAYSDQATVVSEAVLIESEADRQRLLQSVDRIPRPDGCTAFYEGMLKAAEQIAPFTTPDRQSRVLILSDGCANRGPSTLESLRSDVALLRASGILISTYGLGANFAESFMTGVAKAGGGFAQFCQEAEEIGAYFSDEYRILSNTVGHRAKLTFKDDRILMLDPVTDVPQAITMDFPLLVQGGEAIWSGYIPAERLRLWSEEKALQLDAQLEYVDAKGKTIQITASAFVHIDHEGANLETTNPFAAARLIEIRAARTQNKAAEAMQKGDRATAEKQVGILRSMSANNAYVRGVAEQLSQSLEANDANQFSKEALYASVAMTSRIVDAGDTGVAMDDQWGMKRGVQGSKKRTE